MEELDYEVHYDVAKVAENAIGNNPDFCTGCTGSCTGNGGGYVVALKMSADTVLLEDLDTLSQVDVAAGRCARNDAYLGKVNLLGSFRYIGPDGALWGYDLARHDGLDVQQPLFRLPRQDADELPVYDMKPLLNAAERIFGTADSQRFPIRPGSCLAGEGRRMEARGPVWIWSVMGVAIPANRNVAAVTVACDAGLFGNGSNDENDMIGYADGALRRVAHGLLAAGNDMQAVWEKLYVGCKYIFVEPEHLGCVVAYAPAFRLARRCVPEGRRPAEMATLTLSQWEKMQGFAGRAD